MSVTAPHSVWTPLSKLPTHSRSFKVSAFWNIMLCSIVTKVTLTWKHGGRMFIWSVKMLVSLYWTTRLRSPGSVTVSYSNIAHTSLFTALCYGPHLSIKVIYNVNNRLMVEDLGLAGCADVLLRNECIPQFQESTHPLEQCPIRPKSSVTPLWKPQILHCELPFINYQTSHSSSLFMRVGTLIVATIYLQLIQNRYTFQSFTVLQCSHQHCVQPVASDAEVLGYL